MQKLMRVSYRFRILFQVIFVGYFLMNAILWLLANHSGPQIFLSLPGILTTSEQFLGFLISLIPLTVILYGIYQLIALFKNYEKGFVFTLNNVKHYKNIGYSVFTYVFANFLSNALMSLLLSFHNTAGKRQIMVAFGSNDIAFLITGGLIILISWVMKEGFKLADDYAHTI